MSTNTFCPKCGAQCQEGGQFCKNCGCDQSAAASPSVTDRSEKSAAAALFFNLYLGVLGIHRFYVGKIGTGILMLLTFGGLLIWSLIDTIIIACSRFKDSQGRYVEFVSADPNTKSIKSGNTALLLALFLSPLGIHRFYVGKIGTGILMILTFGGLGIWALIDVIVIACGNFTDKSGQFLNFRREAAPSPSTVGLIAFIISVIFLFFMLFVLTLVYFAQHAPM